ncbi:hypothetical protein HanRHA438_Chr06g0259711 [Helianthus annuus]|nr:hypothetical protein HanRHA438_Chr06g0259711 [Helianthus annuus]
MLTQLTPVGYYTVYLPLLTFYNPRIYILSRFVKISPLFIIDATCKQMTRVNTSLDTKIRGVTIRMLTGLYLSQRLRPTS